MPIQKSKVEKLIDCLELDEPVAPTVLVGQELLDQIVAELRTQAANASHLRGQAATRTSIMKADTERAGCLVEKVLDLVDSLADQQAMADESTPKAIRDTLLELAVVIGELPQ